MFLWDETGYIMSKLAPFVKQYIRQSGKLANTDLSINEEGSREANSRLPYILILRWEDSNFRMADSKSAALPLGDTAIWTKW